METGDNGLPAGVADAVLNRGDLARALGKSEPTITAWIAEGMPVLKEGTNGSAYEFQLSACYVWLKDRERAERERRDQAENSVRQMRLALVGGESFGGDDRDLSPKERQAVYDAEKAYMLAALQRNELVRRQDVVTAIEDLLLTIRDGVSAIPDRLEREAGLTGRSLEYVVTLCDAVLAEMQSRIEAQLSGGEYRQAAE